MPNSSPNPSLNPSPRRRREAPRACMRTGAARGRAVASRLFLSARPPAVVGAAARARRARHPRQRHPPLRLGDAPAEHQAHARPRRRAELSAAAPRGRCTPAAALAAPRRWRRRWKRRGRPRVVAAPAPRGALCGRDRAPPTAPTHPGAFRAPPAEIAVRAARWATTPTPATATSATRRCCSSAGGTPSSRGRPRRRGARGFPRARGVRCSPRAWRAWPPSTRCCATTRRGCR